MPAAGGLISLSADSASYWRRAAIHADKILKDASPADLPVEQPTKFELVVNLKTAKALALTIPRSLLLRADRVSPGALVARDRRYGAGSFMREHTIRVPTKPSRNTIPSAIGHMRLPLRDRPGSTPLLGLPGTCSRNTRGVNGGWPRDPPL
ncbi:MAG: ABC transporter substrate binding protein [Candidatus Rokuibacteriota bacterium]